MIRDLYEKSYHTVQIEKKMLILKLEAHGPHRSPEKQVQIKKTHLSKAMKLS